MNSVSRNIAVCRFCNDDWQTFAEPTPRQEVKGYSLSGQDKRFHTSQPCLAYAYHFLDSKSRFSEWRYRQVTQTVCAGQRTV